MENYTSFTKYPDLKAKNVIKINWLNEINPLDAENTSYLPYAYGKSYGDSCLNEGGTLIDTSGLNKFIEFDEQNGRIKCEAGVTLDDVLKVSFDKGYFIQATPGTKHISVAGALANDVHGKNHHVGGTFGCHVNSFELIRSDGEKLICSKNQNSELFNATIGGLGLTGLITWVDFNLKKVPSKFIKNESIKFGSLEEFFDINDDSKNFDYVVSWVDVSSKGKNLGRGLFGRGNFANPEIDEIPKEPNKKIINFPIEAPFINPLSVKAFNFLYYNKQRAKIKKDIVYYEPFFYPLDAINNWNKAYGGKGFLQYQFVIPFDDALKNMKAIFKIISDSGMSSFLTVLKNFGDVKSPGMLSFPRPGVTLAIDFPFKGEKTLDLLIKCDKIVRDAGGAWYPAKDARMSGSDFRASYPKLDEFTNYIDPKFSSSFWRRVMKKDN